MNPMEEQTGLQHGTIMKELSDIKASSAVQTSEIINIKSTIAEIKQDIREIKTNAVSRQEFSDSNKTTLESSQDHEDRIRVLEQFKWQLIGGLIALQALGDYVLYVVLKR